MNKTTKTQEKYENTLNNIPDFKSNSHARKEVEEVLKALKEQEEEMSQEKNEAADYLIDIYSKQLKKQRQVVLAEARAKFEEVLKEYLPQFKQYCKQPRSGDFTIKEWIDEIMTSIDRDIKNNNAGNTLASEPVVGKEGEKPCVPLIEEALNSSSTHKSRKLGVRECTSSNEEDLNVYTNDVIGNTDKTPSSPIDTRSTEDRGSNVCKRCNHLEDSHSRTMRNPTPQDCWYPKCRCQKFTPIKKEEVRG